AHDHARRAISALHRVRIDERLLKRMKTSVFFEAFDGDDLFAGGRAYGCDAGTRRLSVDQHRARSALAFAASVFAARQVQIFAQNREEASARVRLKPASDVVYVEFKR